MAVVVAAAILRDGRVLVGRRRTGPYAGRYEFPGGKVEPGEDEGAALVRECREELGVEVEVGERIGADTAIDAGVLRLFAAVTGGEPQARDHDDLRWCGAADIDALPWIAADRPLVDAVRSRLA
ncbi:MAG: (deoxy)nucleoside triphosphate pyrophosphohydrolase [Mycobacteriales bacterium]